MLHCHTHTKYAFIHACMHNSSYSTHVLVCTKALRDKQIHLATNCFFIHSHIYSPELKGDCSVIGAQQKQWKTLLFKRIHIYRCTYRNKQEINTVCADCVYVVSIHPCGSLHLTPLIVTTQSSSINSRVNLVFWFISFYHSLSPSTLFTLCRLYFHPRASTLLAFG